jgi:hypothetical protein
MLISYFVIKILKRIIFKWYCSQWVESEKWERSHLKFIIYLSIQQSTALILVQAWFLRAEEF